MDGQKIKDLRLKSGISQEELANMLFISRDLVSKWETNKRQPTNEMIKAMSLIFAVDPDDIAPTNEALVNELNSCIPSNCAIDSFQIHETLNTFLSILSVRDRNIFISRYYYRHSISEICQEYRITKNYTRVILHRNRKKLKIFLEELQK